MNGTIARVNGVAIGATPFTTNFTIGGLGAGLGDYSLTSSNGFVFLNLGAVPEPSAFVCVSTAVFGFAVHRLRRRSKRE